MSAKRIITVFGATGSQGGSVARSFLEDPKLKGIWAVRAVTRDTTKEAAKKLENAGAQLVSADLNDKASIVRVIRGADAVYAVTNYWEKMDMKHEIQQGKNIMDAVKETQVPHVVWSSLPNATEISRGQTPNVHHFDSKAAVEKYARGLKVPASFFMPGFYMSNITQGMLRLNLETNAYVLSMPVPSSTPIPVFNVADTGKWVKKMVLKPDQVIGKNILGATKYQTPAEILQDFKEAYPIGGSTASYFQLSESMFMGILMRTGMPDFAARETLENFLLMTHGGYFGGLTLDESLKLVEETPTTWTDFMKTSGAFNDLS